MELYTLGRDYSKQNIIDNFDSVIWTERYYGDSNVELVVPATPEMFSKLPLGIFLGLEGSDELMILETEKIEAGKLKFSGISILPWLNNRFIRTSASHADKYWYLEGISAGSILWGMVYFMCVDGPYVNGSIPIGVPNPGNLIIPGLGLNDYDKSGEPLKVGIPYGPLYDAMRDIATTYEIGMKIIFDLNASNPLEFRSYKGLDRTSAQSDNSVIRFSSEMDSLADIKELQSIATLKTEIYAFAPGLNPDEGQPDLRGAPGISKLTDQEYTGFDLRTKMIFAEDITTDQVGSDPDTLLDILNNRAHDELTNDHYVKTVDGEIVPDNQFQYGVHYNLGDLIEVQGNTGVVQISRVTEYIRSQDSSGEKAYPTLSGVE